MSRMLEVKNLSVELERNLVLENLSFGVEPGETLVILGPNGAGKTVLLKTLLGLLPHKGTIEWRKGIKIGYVPQSLPVIKDIPMSVQDFFELRKVAEEEAKLILRSVGMKEDALEKGISQFSSGQFQRILIGWALSGNPDVLLFDEPTTGIDIGGEETIYNLLEKLKDEKGLTMILVSHDLSVVYKFAANVLCLNKKLICTGLPQEVLTKETLGQLYGSEVKIYKHEHE